MDNLWILTEERPKISVIRSILELYSQEFSAKLIVSNLKIKPILENQKFKFMYTVEGANIEGIHEIHIKTVSGESSFIDFLVFKQSDEPLPSNDNNLIFAIEETKTSDLESRNTGVSQRSSKFVYVDIFYKNIKKFMLYNEELEDRDDKKPSDTSIFGTNMLLTIGVKILGKDTSEWYKPFESLDELIDFKSRMRKPPAGNVPIEITKFKDRIEVSGRLAKPADAGNIGHDPSIGGLSIIAKCIRHLGWTKDIVITRHGVTQTYIDKTAGKSKFLYICKLLDLKMADLTLPSQINYPTSYWHYEQSSEKITSIFLHVLAEYNGLRGIYENHAGCERGYFKSRNNHLITLPKKDKNGVNLYLPDLIIHSEEHKNILVIEGKKHSTLEAGVQEIENYDSIEAEYILPHYPDYEIQRWVTLFGGTGVKVPHDKVLLLVNNDGDIILNPNAPSHIASLFR